jgi:imidazole glycerol-phosphate synthase subunit HisF
MLKKRLIFILYYNAGIFCLSRNFKLQKVGDAKWLVDRFRFKSIGSYIDEIVVLDVNRENKQQKCNGQDYLKSLEYLMKETFVPLTIGGGLRDLDQVKQCFEFGADKVLFNSPIIENPSFVEQCIDRYGAQAVVASVDFISSSNGYISKLHNGEDEGLKIDSHLQKINDLGVGEVMINSIDMDGTGMGFDMELIKQCDQIRAPLIVAGGAGKPEHFSDILILDTVQAAATGNLFNFIGKGFESVLNYLIEQNFPVRNSKQ